MNVNWKLKLYLWIRELDVMNPICDDFDLVLNFECSVHWRGYNERVISIWSNRHGWSTIFGFGINVHCFCFKWSSFYFHYILILFIHTSSSKYCFFHWPLQMAIECDLPQANTINNRSIEDRLLQVEQNSTFRSFARKNCLQTANKWNKKLNWLKLKQYISVEQWLWFKNDVVVSAWANRIFRFN